MQKQHSLSQNSRWVSKQQSVLVDFINEKKSEIVGRNDANVLVYVSVDDVSLYKAGDMVSCFISDASPHGLKAIVKC